MGRRKQLSMAPRATVIVVALGGIACNALFGDTSQCAIDADCDEISPGAMCGSEGTCISPGGPQGIDVPVGDASSPPPPPGTPPDPGTDAGPVPAPDSGPTPGTLTNITIDPATADVAATRTRQFTATGRDAFGNAVPVPPTFTWAVAGGGTISADGLFTAGTALGGPFTVTATSGSVASTSTLNVTRYFFNIGETNLLTVDDSGKLDMLLAQEATLSQPAVIRSLRLYVANAAGKVRFGLYDATGPGGGPGALKAETLEADAAAGFQRINVITQVSLPAGNYWLAYATNDNAFAARRAGNNTGKTAFYAQPYGPMPATFSTTPTNVTDHWSFYATLSIP